MDYFDYIDEDEHQYRPKRMRLERIDPLLQHDEGEFRDRFRMSKMCAIILCAELSHSLDAHRSGDYVLSPMMQILVALRFYADGSFLRSVGDLFQISIASVSRIIHRVSLVISHRRKDFITFPSDNEIGLAKRSFYDIAQFPGKPI